MAAALTIQTFPSWNDTAYELFQNLMPKIYRSQQLGLKKQPAGPLPYFQQALVVLSGHEPVGGACLYQNPHLRYNGGECLLIGNVEAVPDEAVAGLIFSYAETMARNNRLPFMIGPMNGSTWEDYRLMLDTASPLFFTEKPQPAYYNDFFKTSGFEVISHYTTDISTQLVHETEALRMIQQQMVAAGLCLRELDINNFEAELARIHVLCSAGFQNSFLYTPITQEEFIERYRPLQPLIDPAFALVAEDATGALQALYLCLPDVYGREQKQLIIKTIVKHPQCLHKSIMAWMGAEIYRRAAAQHYKAIIHAFMQETARSNPLSQHFGGRPYRRYALYGKAIV
jgi:hypothetical protein